MAGVVVTLEWYEIDMAGHVGLSRYVHSRKSGYQNAHGLSPEAGNLENDINSAGAECAFAKHTGMYWSGSVNTFKLPDVGIVQVRSTDHKNGHLIIREDDSDDELFVLMTGKMPSFTYHGWIRAGYGKLDAWLEAPNGRPPAWFVPQSALTINSKQ